MSFPRDRVPVSVVVGVAIMVVLAKDALVGDARWWNLVMAGLLLVLLARYLWWDRTSRR